MKNVLDKKSLFEFKRAIGLAAHGTGVGSFVYLRRIFEGLITETYETYKASIGIQDRVFASSRERKHNCNGGTIHGLPPNLLGIGLP